MSKTDFESENLDGSALRNDDMDVHELGQQRFEGARAGVVEAEGYNSVLNVRNLSHQDHVDDEDLDIIDQEDILDIAEPELIDKYVETENSQEIDQENDQLSDQRTGQQIDLVENAMRNSRFAHCGRLPVGFDKLVIFYRLQDDEKLSADLPAAQKLKHNISCRIVSSGGKGLLIQFNATQLTDQSEVKPLSLHEYNEHLLLLEHVIKTSILSTFTLERCLLSHVEIFKTIKVDNTPLDYRDCLRHLESSGAYKKAYEFDGVCGGSFYIQNKTDSFIFYDKSSEWNNSKSKDVARKMENGWMRIEWKIRAKSGGIRRKLGFGNLLGLLANYDRIVDNYTQQLSNILPAIDVGPEITMGATEKDFRELLETFGMQKLIKHLGYTYLVENKILERYSRASRWYVDDLKRWRADKVAHVAYMKLTSKVPCIVLFNELRDKVLNNNDVIQVEGV